MNCPMTVIVCRQTYLIVSGPPKDPNRRHLFIICTNPSEEGKVIAVPVQTIRDAPHDPTVELEAHEHKFIKHPSFIAYYEARVLDVVKIKRLIDKGDAKRHDDMNGQTFLRIRNGIERSKHTKLMIKIFLAQ